MGKYLGTLMVLSLCWSFPSSADSIDARCDVYAAGEDHTDQVLPCVFSQRQGAVSIAFADGTRYQLSPVGSDPGNYEDDAGRRVYRQSGLGQEGLIFRFPRKSIYVYWNTSVLYPPVEDPDNPTAPYSTADYDATTLLQCQAGEVETMCPAGIARMDDGQASITITSPAGEAFTVNFINDYINAAGRSVVARLEADTWFLVVDDSESYQVPLAAIEGG